MGSSLVLSFVSLAGNTAPSVSRECSHHSQPRPLVGLVPRVSAHVMLDVCLQTGGAIWQGLGSMILSFVSFTLNIAPVVSAA